MPSGPRFNQTERDRSTRADFACHLTCFETHLDNTYSGPVRGELDTAGTKAWWSFQAWDRRVAMGILRFNEDTSASQTQGLLQPADDLTWAHTFDIITKIVFVTFLISEHHARRY